MKIKFFTLLIFIAWIFVLGIKSALAGSATLTWNANTESDLAGYKVYYGTAQRTGNDPKSCSLCGYTSTLSIGNTTSHVFNNLADGQTFYFSVTAYDIYGNESVFSNEVSKIYQGDVTAPTISSFTASPTSIVSGNSSTLSWTTSGAATVSINQGIGSQAATSTGSTIVSPSSTTIYTLTAANANGTTTATATVTVDTTAPTISSIASSTSATAATITWATNETADSQVLYGLSSAYGSSSTLDTALVTSHSVSLSSLASSTLYHFQIRTKDSSNNLATSSDLTFTTANTADTASPTIPSALSASAVSTTQINLSWTASTDNIGVAGYHIFRNSVLVATTTQTTYQDSSLSAATSYSYAVSAFDASGNESAQSSAASATTQSNSTPPPSTGGGGGGGGPTLSFSSITASSPSSSPTTALISWQTIGYNTDSYVDYGTSTAYSLTASSSTLTSSHALTLTNLLPNTLYHYRVRTSQGLASSDYTFTSGQASSIVNTNNNTPSLIKLKLINHQGTFYLIKNSQRYGITSPGILYSYGFEFKDAKAATEADLALPLGSLLLPGNGYLVKGQKDKTVYLISNSQRYAFTSEAVFKALGFSFKYVFVVTDPELNSLPQADNINNGQAAHLPGLDILDHGTVYWLGYDHQKHGYPSLAIYNSWHKDNDFTQVVPINSADGDIPLGDHVTMRVVE